MRTIDISFSSIYATGGDQATLSIAPSIHGHDDIVFHFAQCTESRFSGVPPVILPFDYRPVEDPGREVKEDAVFRGILR
jgi:hypothetical protein